MGRLWKIFFIILVGFIVLKNLSEAGAKPDSRDDDYDYADDYWIKKDSSKIIRAHPKAVPQSKSTHSITNKPSYHPAEKSSTPRRRHYRETKFASHNESCSPSRSCKQNANIECSSKYGTGRCQCSGRTVYVHETETCWNIILSSEEECAHDIQCQAGRWGHLSRCNNDVARCECYDRSGNMSETIRSSKNGVCLIKKRVGDHCNSHEECSDTIPGEAYCQFAHYSLSGTIWYEAQCQCDRTSFWHEGSGKCLLRIIKLNDSCEYDDQCQSGRWGQLSRCNNKTAKCECYYYLRQFEVVQSDTDGFGICIFREKVGDSCRTRDDCKTIPGEAYCQYNDHHKGTINANSFKGTCQCKYTSTWHESSGKCLLKATKLGDPCEVSDQCRDGALGMLSTCDRDTEKCVCIKFGETMNKTEIIYYERLRKCFVKREYNDTCREDDECRAYLGPDVECGPTEYTHDYVCHCPKGRICMMFESDVNKTEEYNYESLKLIAGIVAAIIVIAAVCFVVWLSHPVCIFDKMHHWRRSMIRTGNETTTCSNEHTFTVTAIASASSRTTNPFIGTPINYKTEINSNSETAFAVPLLQPEQPIQYSRPSQPINFGYSRNNESEYHPQEFELLSPCPGLPRDSEILNLPNNPSFNGNDNQESNVPSK